MRHHLLLAAPLALPLAHGAVTRPPQETVRIVRPDALLAGTRLSSGGGVTLSLVMDGQRDSIREVRLGDTTLQGEIVRLEPGALHLLGPTGKSLLDVTLNGTVRDLLSLGCPPAETRRVQIGITMEDLPPALAAHLRAGEEAVMIASVQEGGAAARAGLQAYDVVTGVDGSAGVSQESFRAAIQRKSPGETIRLTVIRGGKATEIAVTVEACTIATEIDTVWVADLLARQPWTITTQGPQAHPYVTGQLGPSGRYVVATQPLLTYQTWLDSATAGAALPSGLREQFEQEIAQLEAQVARLKALLARIDEAAADAPPAP